MIFPLPCNKTKYYSGRANDGLALFIASQKKCVVATDLTRCIPGPEIPSAFLAPPKFLHGIESNKRSY